MTTTCRGARLFREATHELAEGPLWFEGLWWWVDIEAGALHSCDLRGGNAKSHSFGQRLGAAGPLPGGRFLLALQEGLAEWSPTSDELRFLAHPDRDIPGNRCNDGKLDPVGRFVVGTLNMKGNRGVASLYSFEFPDKLTRLLDGLHLSNGLAWTADGGTMYHVDSLAHEISAYDYDLSTGAISNRRVVIRVPTTMGLPDGLDIDADGNLWVAHWGGYAVRCWSPGDGRCLEEISVPCSQPSSCHFGGPNKDQLLITTARVGLSPDELSRQPLAGSLFLA